MNLVSLDSLSTLSPNGGMYDPEYPDAASVMVSLLHVTTIYMNRPSLDLAKLALRLTETLMAPEYAETEFICKVSRRMCIHWTVLINDYQHPASTQKSDCQKRDCL